MFNKFLKKRDNRKFRDGFKWAMAAYFIDSVTTTEIQSYVDESEMFGSASSFDKGISFAITKIENL